ncbi:hypothetical protein [Tuberibacillus calidus]|jgi:hypothetical protein|uniref:hypothetical protein n=1 Tax=Tuberibacillus calidus TaxID=340097 RepID=UPI00041EAB01|nr:hypothetical protein [Tuberibacillus calidus]
MKRLFWIVIGLIVTISVFWFIGESYFSKTAGSQAKIFIYRDDHQLWWLSLTGRSHDVSGEYYRWTIQEKAGSPPTWQKQADSVTGKVTDDGYQLLMNRNGTKETFSAKYVDGKLMVKGFPLTPVSQSKLKSYQQAFKEDWEQTVYVAEQKENERLDRFFSDLRKVYGYLYAPDNSQEWLFLKVEEALREGEWSCTLQVVEKKPHRTTTYHLNGITDGLMAKLYTTVDGKSVTLEGKFRNVAKDLELTYWKTGETVHFQAVNETEYQKRWRSFLEGDQ